MSCTATFSSSQIRQRLLVGRRACGHGRGEPDPEAQLSGGADAVDRLGPGPCSTMKVVDVRRGAVHTDLEHQALPRHRLEDPQPGSTEEHPVGQHHRRGCGDAAVDDGANLLAHERLSAGQVDLLHAGRHGLVDDLRYRLRAELTWSRLRERREAAVVTGEVAVEVGVHPQPVARKPLRRQHRRRVGQRSPVDLDAVRQHRQHGVATGAAPRVDEVDVLASCRGHRHRRSGGRCADAFQQVDRQQGPVHQLTIGTRRSALGRPRTGTRTPRAAGAPTGSAPQARGWPGAPGCPSPSRGDAPPRGR